LSIALDATYSVGRELSGVGVYSREVLFGLASAHPDQRFQFCYRPHRYLRSLREDLPANCSRRLLYRSASGDLFHGLNQRLPGKKFRVAVTTFHDLFVLTGDYSSADFKARFAAQARHAAASSDLIICVSGFTALQVRDLLGVPESRVRVIHHGVHLPLSVPSVAREPMILHVGTIQKRKNVERLVKAFAAMPDPWRLVLAGASGFGSGEIATAIESSPARSRIETPGYVSRERLSQLYARASVFAFPSLDEGFGMPVLDAMAHGVPVLTSDGSALREVAGDAALLVDPTDVDSIADGMHRLVLNEDLRAELREEGLKRAVQFSWSAAVEKTWKVYRELLG
jgi:glycosyltransferase involved in cell wall biosynthesis